MSKPEISAKILNTIKEKKISPIPKWHFIFKNLLIWILSLISLFIGALSFAIILHLFINNDWDVYKNINDSLIGFILLTLPYFWLVFLIIFILLGYYNFKLTKKGYKFPFLTVLIINILISILFGALLYDVGIGQAIDQTLAKKTPLYNKYINKRENIWCQPEQGRLAGIIIEIKDENIFLLHDMTKKEWQIINNQPIKLRMQPGIKIRVIGQQIEPAKFQAIQIMPFRPNLPKNFQELIHQKKINYYIFERNNF